MNHADEEPGFSAATAARRQDYLADVDGLIEAFEELRLRDVGTAGQAEALQAELQKLQQENITLRSDLRAARTEVQRLKAVLTSLRRSSTMRAGKAVLRPARTLQKAATALRPSGKSAQAGTAPGGRDRKRPAGTGAQALNGAPVPDQAAQAPAPENPRTPDALADPTPANLARAASHGYFELGEISGPARLLKEYPDAAAALTGADRKAAEAVLGLDRLLSELPRLAPRQPNPGYLAERGRLMYCAHSTAEFNSNGYSTRTGALVAALAEHGMDVTVTARPGYPWDVSTDLPAPVRERFTRDILGVRHVFNPGPSWTKQPLDRYWAEATDVYVREAQRMRAAAIHSASNHVTALPALVAARRLGLPFSYEVRGLWEVTEASERQSWADTERFQLARRLETYVATNADVVFAITEEVKNELISRGVEPGRIRLLPNGVDTDRFAPLPPSPAMRSRLNVPEGVPVVGYAGSLVHYEGLTDLLEALALLRKDGVEFRAVIVGDGRELADLKSQAARLELNGVVRFTGRVNAADVPEYVSVFDIMPCPRTSLPVTELVSPLKPLEAMAAGKAVVLTDLAPMRLFAGPDQERALLARPSDPVSLARALRTLIEDDSRRSLLGHRARLWTVRERQWSTIGRQAALDLADAHTAAAASAPRGRSLDTLTVGIIADTFTTEGLRPEVSLCELRPDSWRAQMQEQRLDALFVESAWEGLDGEWNHKVGYYDEESFRDLQELLDHCRSEGIPTIFWNKEDPVHFNRFQTTAAKFDHVFTTDAACIPRYAASAGPRTVASLPFYAQPRLHNPLPPSLPYRHTVAYAGSYYGDRYPERSAELAALLSAARRHGLTIYDRQHLNPDSPYRFPPELQQYVEGGLPYLEMVEAYKAHPVHINVNSVEGSPTMFSRRVAELAASGTAVLSGRGSGVDLVMGGLVHTVHGSREAEILLDRWMGEERARLADAWLAYRLIHRGHTAAHRLAYALRCAGLTVTAPEAPRYALRAEDPTPALIAGLEAQTVRPTAVICPVPPQDPGDLLFLTEAEATPERLARLGVQWIGEVPGRVPDRTTYEDMLTAVRFGNWSALGVSADGCDEPGKGILAYGRPPQGSPVLTAVGTQGSDGPAVTFRRPEPGQTVRSPHGAKAAARAAGPASSQRVLVAGHDLKFATGILESLQAAGHTVVVDKWAGHNQHNEAESKAKLEQADIVFCEWTLGNAVWYSHNLLPGQRLVTRFHSQELFTPHPRAVAMQRVDEVIFVGGHVADLAARDHGVPTRKATVIPNPVAVDALVLPKSAEARFTLGMVGIVPAQKHMDRALDLLRELRRADPRYRLRIKGKQPRDYSWMADRPEEMRFYDEQYRRLEEDPLLHGAVRFDGHGDDMAEWYRGIGTVISLSDFESFHLTLADGAASAAVPASLPWPGADRIYPTSWIHPTIGDLAEYIRQQTGTEEQWRAAGTAASALAQGRFAEGQILPQLLQAILGVKR